MAKTRKKKARRGRPRIMGPTALTSPGSVASSLPPTPPDAQPQVASSLTPQYTERPPVGDKARAWWLPEDSKVRVVALQIMAMRINGMEDADIAKELNLSINSISPYIYRATKNGWLNIDYDPRERLNVQVLHKVVQRLEEGLDSGARLQSGMKERTHVALKMAEGMIFSHDQQVQVGQNTTVVSVKVVMPDGPRQEIRDDTTGGTPAFIDVETQE